MKFTDLGLCEPILRAITSAGYDVPTPIQFKSIPHILAGKDMLGCAQTGTGKTAAFCLPMAQRLMTPPTPPSPDAPVDHSFDKPGESRRPRNDDQRNSGHSARSSHRAPAGRDNGPRRNIRALILSPTRELTLQIAENLSIYAKNSHLRHVVIFGGVSQSAQVRALRDGVDIVVATPGRLEDLMEQGYVDLRHVEIFVLDEADRMLDMGFIEPIRRIAAAVPKKRQTLLFSATMAKEIRRLADTLLTDPVAVDVAPASSLPTLIAHSVFHVHRADKAALLTTVLKTTAVSRALVFTRTKHGADKVVERLLRDGITAEAIHGNKRQNVRQRTLANFKSGRTPVLIATDIAARGIDVDDVSHVINYELPNEPETYVHRIGRTGRAGMTGIAMSFCDHDERSFLRAIERLVKRPIEVVVTPAIKRDPPPAPGAARENGRGSGDRAYSDRPARREYDNRAPRAGGGGNYGPRSGSDRNGSDRSSSDRNSSGRSSYNRDDSSNSRGSSSYGSSSYASSGSGSSGSGSSGSGSSGSGSSGSGSSGGQRSSGRPFSDSRDARPERTNTDRPYEPRANGSRPAQAAPHAAKPAYEKSSIDKPAHAKPAYEKPSGEKPSHAKPAHAKTAHAKTAHAKPAHPKAEHAAPRPSSHRKGPSPAGKGGDKGGPRAARAAAATSPADRAQSRREQPGTGFRGKPRADR